MDATSWLAFGTSVAVSAGTITAAVLSGRHKAEKSVVDLLKTSGETQERTINTMRVEIGQLQAHVVECESDRKNLRSENLELLKRIVGGDKVRT